MDVWGQLNRAQLENRTTDYAPTITGIMWWRTDLGQVKTSDGTNIRAMLRNDQKAIIGNHATAENNIRFHRGADGVLQFVLGDDVTVEGTLSTALNQISGRLENYADAGKPAFGNVGRAIWVTDLAQLQLDTGVAWTGIQTGNRIAAIYTIVLGSAAQVTAGDATHSTWASAIAAASAGDTIRVLPGTWTENVSINKQLWIEGSGYGSDLTGSITFTSAASHGYLSGIKASDNLYFDTGSSLNRAEEIYFPSGKGGLDSGDGNYWDGFQE